MNGSPPLIASAWSGVARAFAGSDEQHDMSEPQPQPSTPPSPPFQFRLRTLLLLFVVLGLSLAVFGGCGVVVFGLVLGLAIYLRVVKNFKSLPYLAFVALCLICAGLLLPQIGASREPGRRVECANNLRQIALALQNYHQANGCFPPAYSADKNGKPMHSWRVLILPYLNRNDLYQAYDFTEPWNGPKNNKLLAKGPRVYICPSDWNASVSGATQTSYVAVVGPNAAWAGEKPRIAPADFPEGTNNTIMVVEVASSGISWTEPKDLSLDTLGKVAGKSAVLMPSSNHVSRLNVAMVDGSVMCLRTDSYSMNDLKKILQNGGCTEEAVRSQEKLYPKPVDWPNIAALAVWLLSVGTLLIGAVRGRKPRAASLNSPVDR